MSIINLSPRNPNNCSVLFDPVTDMAHSCRYYDGIPRHLDKHTVDDQLILLASALTTYANPGCSDLQIMLVASLLSTSHSPHDPSSKFLSLINLTRAAIGTAYLHGYPFREGWHRKQDS